MPLLGPLLISKTFAHLLEKKCAIQQVTFVPPKNVDTGIFV